MKRCLIILSAVLLWGCALPAAATEFEAGDFCYTILSVEDLTVEVIKTVDKYANRLSIPETVEYDGKNYRVAAIGDKVFSQCTSLKSITISSGITSIGDSAFWSCFGLETITIPDNVTTLGNSVFSGCDGLTSVKIGNNVTSIGDCAFFKCLRLTTITVPDKVTSIGKKAFLDCKKLQSVIFGKNLADIGDNAFENCTGLEQITVNNPVPAKAGLSIFKNVPFATCKLYVPAESVEQYTAKSGWKNFTKILPSVTYDFEAASTITPAENDETITALSTFTLTFDKRPFLSATPSATVMKIGGRSYPTRITESQDGKSFIIALQGDEEGQTTGTTLTETGSYTLVIRQGTFGDADFAADPKTGHCNPACFFFYTIKTSASAEPEKPDKPDDPSSITETQQDAEHITVYNLQGVPVLETDDATALRMLPAGAYIVNGKTMIIAR